MIVDHVAAMIFFGGPVFYIGLWMAVDPVGIVTLPEFLVGIIRRVVQCLAGIPRPPLEPNQPEIPRRVRRALRCAGVALLLFAVVI